jgi:hypothetical protein
MPGRGAASRNVGGVAQVIPTSEPDGRRTRRSQPEQAATPRPGIHPDTTLEARGMPIQLCDNGSHEGAENRFICVRKMRAEQSANGWRIGRGHTPVVGRHPVSRLPSQRGRESLVPGQVHKKAAHPGPGGRRLCRLSA